MEQVLIEKISKNKELPKNMLEVYKSFGYLNYKFSDNNSHINDYINICFIVKSLNDLGWKPELNEGLELFYPSFEWDISSGRFVFYDVKRERNNYNGNFSLGFKTLELAEYAGEIFNDQYNKWLIIPENESKLIEEVDYQEIKTMSDVYRVNGITKLTTPPETKERYYEDLILITKALNGNWKPDFQLDNGYKCFPCFDSTTNLLYVDYLYNFSDISISSRLLFKSQEIAEYASRIFIEQYEKLMKFI